MGVKLNKGKEVSTLTPEQQKIEKQIKNGELCIVVYKGLQHSIETKGLKIPQIVDVITQLLNKNHGKKCKKKK